MKVVSLPSEELRLALLDGSEVTYRRQQAQSDLPNHKEFAEAWLQGYRYGVESALASFQPAEAKAALDSIQQALESLKEYERKLVQKAKESGYTAAYYQRQVK